MLLAIALLAQACVALVPVPAVNVTAYLGMGRNIELKSSGTSV